MGQAEQQNNAPFRVGIVGAGDHAYAHGRACQSVARAELTAVCDLDPGRLQIFGDHFSVPGRYDSLEAMLEREQLDLVIICTWGNTHAELSNALARSDKVRAILVEKPISMTAAECTQMAAVAHEHQVILTEGLKYRHHPQHLQLEQIIRSGRIGAVRSLRCTLASPTLGSMAAGNWRFDPARGGGAIYDLACYTICFARYIVGREPLRVYASGTLSPQVPVDLTASIHLEFPDGVTAALFSSFECDNCQSTEVVGTDGWIRLNLHYDGESEQGLEIFTAGQREVYHFEALDQFALQLDHLCDCLESGLSPRITPAFSLGNMQVIDAVFASLKGKCPIDL